MGSYSVFFVGSWIVAAGLAAPGLGIDADLDLIKVFACAVSSLALVAATPPYCSARMRAFLD